jgi:hypothetical protein
MPQICTWPNSQPPAGGQERGPSSAFRFMQVEGRLCSQQSPLIISSTIGIY